MTVRALMVIALVVSLAGCGGANVQLPSSGTDQLVIPTPSPDPDDFVRGVDNPWMPLPDGRTWTYQVVGVDGSDEQKVTVAAGPEVDGVPTTARVTTGPDTVTTDWFAQDAAGNVWWFGREGEWTAGTDGAEAGLAMAADPRVGDGYRTAYQRGVVEDVATVLALDGSATVPAGSYDDLVVTRDTSETGSVEQSWARGIGLVEATRPGQTVRLTKVSS
ncbi:hypothetical protein [Nocardioides conyzicola]